jgi:hypothetical protein
MAGFSVGAATRDISPTPAMLQSGELYLGGFAGRTAPCDTVHTPLSVRAIAMRDAASTLAVLVAVDATSFDRSFTQAVTSTPAVSGLGLSTTNLAIAAIHTHSAPVTKYWPTWPAVLQNPYPPYMTLLHGQTVGVIEDALAALAPATAHFGRGTTAIGVSRRAAGRLIDDSVDVLTFLDPSAHRIATLFVASCHPVVNTLTLATPDFPAQARTTVEEQLGGIAVFFQGFGGTINPTIMEGSPDDADSIGQTLGADVVGIVTGGVSPVSGSLTITKGSLTLLGESPPTAGELADALDYDDPADPATSAAVRLWADAYDDPTKLKTSLPTDLLSIRIGAGADGWRGAIFSHELANELAPELRQLWRSSRLTLFGYSGSVDCYLCTQDITALAQRIPYSVPTDYEASQAVVWYGLRQGLAVNSQDQFVDAAATLDPEAVGITNTPAVLLLPDGRLTAFARHPDGSVVQSLQTTVAGPWGPWTSIGGNITGSPVAHYKNVAGGCILTVFARGVDGDVQQSWQASPGGPWVAWQSIGGSITGIPSVVKMGDDAGGTRFAIFARSAAGQAIQTAEASDGGGFDPSWPSDSLAGFTITDSPAGIAYRDETLAVFGRGLDAGVWWTYQEAPATTEGFLPPMTLGPSILGAPVPMLFDTDVLSVFATGNASAVWQKTQNAAADWDDWAELQLGQITGVPAVVVLPSGAFAVFGRGGDGIVWQTSQPAPTDAWDTWTVAGTGCPGVTGSPVALLVGDVVHLFARTVNADVAQCVQTSPLGPFGAWSSIGPPV